jgi:UDPglucose 6-dehydrogenase
VTRMGAVPWLDLERLQAVMLAPVVIDLRNIYRADEMIKRGFVYKSIGRAVIKG